MWIVNEASSNAKNLPQGFLTVRLRQSLSSSLRDALIVASDGIEFLRKTNQWTNIPKPPSNCSSTSILDEWTSKVGTKFYKLVKFIKIFI